MKLLGLYNSKLQAFHFAELLQLYKTAIANGDHAGSIAFNESAVTTLITQSQDFSSLSTASAGQTVTDDSLNHPLSLLSARFSALVSEAQDFDNRAAGLISVMEKDTSLLDQLLSAADLQQWIDQQPKLSRPTKFAWDFGMGHGPSDGTILPIDPTNGVTYPSECPVGTYLFLEDGIQNTGLVAPSDTTLTTSKNMIWTLFGPGQSEDLYGDGWTELTVLTDQPVLSFQSNPVIQVLLPNNAKVDNIFQVQGSFFGGSLPVYIRTLFSPRRNSIQMLPQNDLPDGSAEAGGTEWTLGAGWTIDSSGQARTGSNAFSVSNTANVVFDTSFDLTAFSEVVSGDTGSFDTSFDPIAFSEASESGIISGNLISPSIPISQNQYVYIDLYVKSIGGNGAMSIYLSCQDVNDNEISRVYLPVITPPGDYLQIAENIQITNDPAIVSFQIVIGMNNFTVGTWYLDDIRVHLPQNLSSYVINPDSTSTYTTKLNGEPYQVFFNQEQFIVDDSSNITFLNLPDGQTFTVRFTELYPGYQCSINEKAWSPLIMLDPNRPYPDDEEFFNPIHLGLDFTNQRVLFPITDELGVPTGMTLKMIGQPIYEYYFVVTTPADPHYGISGVLEIDMTKSAYLTGLTISSFSNFPIRLLRVECEAFTSNTRHTIGQPNALVDRPINIVFPPTLVRKFFLTCYQENYTLEEHIVQPPDQLRRDTLVAVQASLPFNIRRTTRAVSTRERGFQYGFGLEDIAGVISQNTLPGVYVAGKYRYRGCPEIIRYDVQLGDISNVETYLCWLAYDASGNIIDSELVGQIIIPGSCNVFPFSSGLDRTTVDHIDTYLKFVLRTNEAVVEKFLLQMTNVQ